MAEETDAWWSLNFPKYTLRNLNSMPIYSSFKSAKGYFSRSDGSRTDAYWTVDQCNIYEWFLSTANKGEKIGYDTSGKTWFYEMWTPEADHHLTVKTWLTAGAEWGVIVRRHPDKETRERWSLDHGSKSYEIVEVANKRTTKRRVGYTPLGDGLDQWTEHTVETRDETRFERTWERPESKGGETKTQRGTGQSGRAWFQKGADYEEKLWNSDIDREWGSISGMRAGQHYEEKWDVDGGNRVETKEYSEGAREWGSRNETQGAHWRKEEWEGLRPVNSGGTASYLPALSRNFEEAMSVVFESETNLERMIDARGKPDLEDLKDRRKGIAPPPPDEPEAIIQAVSMVHRLLRDHETLKQAILSQVPISDLSKLTQNITTLADLHCSQLQELANSKAADEHFTATELQLREKHSQLAGLTGLESLTQTVSLLREQVALQQGISAQLLAKVTEEEAHSETAMLSAQLREFAAQRDLEQSAHMKQLSQLTVIAEGVCSSLAETLNDSTAKASLEALEPKFESTEEYTAISQFFELLNQYQPVTYQLVSRLQGLTSEEAAHNFSAVTKSSVKLRHDKGNSPPSVFDLISGKLTENLELACSAIVGLTGDESTSSMIADIDDSEDEAIPLVLKKLDMLQGLLNTLSLLEVNEENTETQSVQQETKEEAVRDAAETEVERLTIELCKREALLKEVNSELAELRSEHAAYKQLSADLAVAQAENQQLTKQLADLSQRKVD